MAIKTLIGTGSSIGDPTAEGLRDGGLRLNNLKAGTYVCSSSQFGGSTAAQIIQNTINAAVTDGIAIVEVPLQDNSLSPPVTLLPYSGVTFNNAVRMTAQGYNAGEWNVRAYGASGDGVTNDQNAIQQCINAASAQSIFKLQGNIVKFPAGQYVHTSTIQVPIALNQGQVILRGDGMDNTILYPSGPSTNFTIAPLYNTCLLFGSAAPDAAGTTTQNTQYCGMENMSSSGTLITTGNVVAVQFTQMQKGWMANCIITAFPNNSIGLYLRGSTITGGLGTNTTAPHCWRSSFSNCVISNMGSGGGGRPVILQNADENYFENCVHGIATGQTAGADSLFCTWIQLGRNNIFVDCLQSGERTSLKTAYVGMVFGPPQNEAGAANGSVLGNCDYGAVMEGFDRCVWFQADSSGNLLGNAVLNSNPSIYTTAYLDSTQPANPGGFTGGGQGGNIYEAALINLTYRATAGPVTPTATLLNNSTAPSVGGADCWAASNSVGTIITDFLSAAGVSGAAGLDGRRITIRATNGNTTIRDVNNGGGGNIRNYGRQDIVMAANWVVSYQMIMGIWHQITPVRIEGGQGAICGAVLATTTTRGFHYVPTCAGTPTGVPTELPTGAVPMIFDTSGVKVWIYTAGAWKGVVVS